MYEIRLLLAIGSILASTQAPSVPLPLGTALLPSQQKLLSAVSTRKWEHWSRKRKRKKRGLDRTTPIILAPTKLKPAAPSCWDHFRDKAYYCLYAMGTITFRKNEASSLFSGITSFAGSNQMIFLSMLTCTIWSQGGPNKMAAANFLWLHFQNNRGSIQSFFFLRSVNETHGPFCIALSHFSLLHASLNQNELRLQAQPQ